MSRLVTEVVPPTSYLIVELVDYISCSEKNHIERFGNQTKHSMGELDGDNDSILKALSSKTVAKDFPF